jgi:hypothetical protein
MGNHINLWSARIGQNGFNETPGQLWGEKDKKIWAILGGMAQRD